MKELRVILYNVWVFVALIHLFKSVESAMCHVSTLGKRTEGCFDMYGNKSEKTSGGQHQLTDTSH